MPYLPTCQLSAGNGQGRAEVGEGGQRGDTAGGESLVPTWAQGSCSIASPGTVVTLYWRFLTAYTVFQECFLAPARGSYY